MLYMDLLRFIYLFIFSLEEKETDQQEIIKWSVKEGVKELFTVRIKGGSSVMKMMTIVLINIQCLQESLIVENNLSFTMLFL